MKKQIRTVHMKTVYKSIFGTYEYQGNRISNIKMVRGNETTKLSYIILLKPGPMYIILLKYVSIAVPL